MAFNWFKKKQSRDVQTSSDKLEQKQSSEQNSSTLNSSTAQTSTAQTSTAQLNTQREDRQLEENTKPPTPLAKQVATIETETQGSSTPIDEKTTSNLPLDKNDKKPNPKDLDKSDMHSPPAIEVSAFSKLAQSFVGTFNKRKLDHKGLNELFDILIMSDLGVKASTKFISKLRETKFDKHITTHEIKQFLSYEIKNIMTPCAKNIELENGTLNIILMVGVNGSGKTTTIGKLASRYCALGKKVILGAGDTFRAAAASQLKIWADRVGATIVLGAEKSDCAALVYKALDKALNDNYDVLIIDTAGRLHNKVDLMNELKKITKVIKKLTTTSPLKTVLVLDGTVGQNALSQMKNFNEIVEIDGVIMTKLDGTAKGGVLVNLAFEFNKPIYAIGMGEAVSDLIDFDATSFSNAILGLK